MGIDARQSRQRHESSRVERQQHETINIATLGWALKTETETRAGTSKGRVEKWKSGSSRGKQRK